MKNLYEIDILGEELSRHMPHWLSPYWKEKKQQHEASKIASLPSKVISAVTCKVYRNPQRQQWANVAMGFMNGESRILEKDGDYYIWEAGKPGAIHYQIALDLGLEAPYKFTVIRKWEGEQIGWDYRRLRELGPNLWHKGYGNPLKQGHLAGDESWWDKLSYEEQKNWKEVLHPHSKKEYTKGPSSGKAPAVAPVQKVKAPAPIPVQTPIQEKVKWSIPQGSRTGLSPEEFNKALEGFKKDPRELMMGAAQLHMSWAQIDTIHKMWQAELDKMKATTQKRILWQMYEPLKVAPPNPR